MNGGKSTNLTDTLAHQGVYDHLIAVVHLFQWEPTIKISVQLVPYLTEYGISHLV